MAATNKPLTLEAAAKRACVILKDCTDPKAQQAFDLLLEGLQVQRSAPPAEAVYVEPPPEQSLSAHTVGKRLRRTDGK
jgi:hypothetical protein